MTVNLKNMSDKQSAESQPSYSLDDPAIISTSGPKEETKNKSGHSSAGHELGVTQLEHTYVFWILLRNQGSANDNYEAQMKNIAKFNTVNHVIINILG